jgi:hypothetical protein
MAGDVVTLADVALTTQDKVLEKFVKNLIRQSKAMGTVPFVTKNVLSVVNKKWKTLPAGQRRDLNEGYQTVKGDTQDETWEPKFYGGDIQIDRQFSNLENAIEDQKSLQTKLFIAGMAATWTYDLIANTPLIRSTPKECMG